MRSAALTLVLLACTPGDPPGAKPESSPSAGPSGTDRKTTIPSSATSAGAAPSTVVMTTIGADAAPSPADSKNGVLPTMPEAGSLAAEDGTQAQTEERPRVDDPLTQARARALFDAIAADLPAAGQDFFFPVDAYKQVKDSSNPESDWKNRLVANYARDVHELHRGKSLQNARFVALEYQDAAARWVKPGEEFNKIGYYRVFNSTLAYDDAGGTRRTILLKSLISWRGRFFLVHLSSIK